MEQEQIEHALRVIDSLENQVADVLNKLKDLREELQPPAKPQTLRDAINVTHDVIMVKIEHIGGTHYVDGIHDVTFNEQTAMYKLRGHYRHQPKLLVGVRFDDYQWSGEGGDVMYYLPEAHIDVEADGYGGAKQHVGILLKERRNAHTSRQIESTAR